LPRTSALLPEEVTQFSRGVHLFLTSMLKCDPTSKRGGLARKVCRAGPDECGLA
jgi:hypothetical protein